MTLCVLLLLFSKGGKDDLCLNELEKALLHFDLPQQETIASLLLFSGSEHFSFKYVVFIQFIVKHNSLFRSISTLKCIFFPAYSPSAVK
jgi:hypothetical protein